MDGPNVNWSLFTKMASYRELNDYPGLLNMGSCGLHVVHGALQTGHKKTGWDLNATLRYAYYFFRDSPARRAQFQTLLFKSFPQKVLWDKMDRKFWSCAKIFTCSSQFGEILSVSKTTTRHYFIP